MQVNSIKTSLHWPFLAIFILMFLSSCQTSESELNLNSPKSSEVSVLKKTSVSQATSTGLINCGFDNATDVLAGNQWNYSVANVVAPHSTYLVEGSWFKAYINKNYTTVPDDVNKRGRAEVGIYPLISSPQGKIAYIKMTYFAPVKCSFSGTPDNMGGGICQLQEEGGAWRPLFLLMIKPSLQLAIYPTTTTSLTTTISTSDQRGTMHTIELWVKITTGTDGYYDAKLDGGATTRLYNGRTLPTGLYSLDWKCGTYSMGPYAFYSEVWIHNNYISW